MTEEVGGHGVLRPPAPQLPAVPPHHRPHPGQPHLVEADVSKVLAPAPPVQPRVESEAAAASQLGQLRTGDGGQSGEGGREGDQGRGRRVLRVEAERARAPSVTLSPAGRDEGGAGDVQQADEEEAEREHLTWPRVSPLTVLAHLKRDKTSSRPAPCPGASQ